MQLNNNREQQGKIIRNLKANFDSRKIFERNENRAQRNKLSTANQIAEKKLLFFERGNVCGNRKNDLNPM